MLSKTRYPYPLLVQPVNDFECRPHALTRESVECPDEQNVESIRRRPGICDDIRKEPLVRALRCGDAGKVIFSHNFEPAHLRKAQQVSPLILDSLVFRADSQPDGSLHASLSSLCGLSWRTYRGHCPSLPLYNYPDIVRMDVPQVRPWGTWVVNVEVALLWS